MHGAHSKECLYWYVHFLFAQNVKVHIADHWKDLILAEQSVLVNIFQCPQALFPPTTKAYQEARQNLLKKYVHVCNAH